MPIITGGLAANPEIYRIGMGADRIDDTGPLWDRSLSQPVEINLVDDAPC